MTYLDTAPPADASPAAGAGPAFRNPGRNPGRIDGRIDGRVLANARRWAPVQALSARIWRRAVGVVALRSGLPPAAVLRPRCRRAYRARHLAYYLAAVEGCVAARQIARLAGVSPRAVRLALAKIEEERDSAAADTLISTLERRLSS